MDFRLDAEHRYWLGEQRLPGVTEIIDYHGFIPDFSKDEERAEEGQVTHEAAALLFQKRLDWLSVDAVILGFVTSLNLWITATDFCAEATELTLHDSALLFAGSLDVDGHTPKGSRWIIDLKTGQPARWHKWQTAGYRILLGEYRRRGALYLQKDGRMARFKEHTEETDEAEFISMRNVFRMKEGY